jgi:hypothetical protein
MSTDKVIYRGIDVTPFQETYGHKHNSLTARKEYVDLYIDHGIINKVLHSDPDFRPTMFMEWEIHGDKLIMKMSKL